MAIGEMLRAEHFPRRIRQRMSLRQDNPALDVTARWWYWAETVIDRTERRWISSTGPDGPGHAGLVGSVCIDAFCSATSRFPSNCYPRWCPDRDLFPRMPPCLSRDYQETT